MMKKLFNQVKWELTVLIERVLKEIIRCTLRLATGEYVHKICQDNVDYNINTLDGLNTLHGMGIIASVTPGNKNHTSMPIILKE